MTEKLGVNEKEPAFGQKTPTTIDGIDFLPSPSSHTKYQYEVQDPEKLR